MKTANKRRILKIALTLVFIVIVIVISKALVNPIIESEGVPKKILRKATRRELEKELKVEKEKLQKKIEECSVCDASLALLTEEVKLLKEDACVVVTEGLEGGA